VAGAGTSTYAVVSGLAYSAVASVVPPTNAVHRLGAIAEGMALPKGIARSLDAKIQAALSAIKAGRNTAAVNQLTAFIAEVKAQTRRFLSTSQAEVLTSEARRIVAALSL
jgi:FIMAH domain-containing protein